MIQWLPMAIGAGAGALKNQEAQRQAEAQRRRAAATERYSPWTGLQAQAIKDPSLMGDIASGAAMGAMAGNMYKGDTTMPKDMSDGDFQSWLKMYNDRKSAVPQ